MATGNIIGKVNTPVSLVKYTGEDTRTATTNVDNDRKVISVDVKVDEVTKDCATKEEVEEVKASVQYLEENKANKEGPLPSYTVNETDNIYEFIHNNNLANKRFVIDVINFYKAILCWCDFGQPGTPHISFDFIVGNGRRFHGSNVEATELTFSQAMSSTYIKDYEITNNKVTSLSSSSTDTQYPSAKAVYDFANLIETTWSALKSKRDSSQLIPGRFYRITDYTCTTTQENTSSAGHVFDIIVRADSTNKLNEKASAIQHDGDTYFSNCKLEAWKLWYCLDNDTNRFAWADSTNGKGVIYRMIDEFDNEAPYDFKNIVNVRWKTNVVTQSNVNYLDVINLEQYFGPDYYDSSDLMAKAKAQYELIRNMFANNIQSAAAYLYTLGIDGAYVRVGDLADEDETFYNFLTDGEYYSLSDDDYIVAICYDDDEGVNTCYMLLDTSEEYELYTFVNGTIDSSSGAISNIVDSSLRLNNEDVYKNSLGVTYNGNALMLSENVFIGKSCSSNTFGDNCNSNTFGWDCQYNTFGDNCRSNTFGNNFYSNTFGDNCFSNTFGYGCYSNTFGNYCYSNTFGNYCYSNTFGGECYYNIFGNSCSFNTFGSSCRFNTFGSNCECIMFGTNPSDFFQNNIIDNGCQYLWLNATSGTASSSNQLQNVHIHLGVKGTSSSDRKTITVDRNLAYETNIVPAGTTTIEV